MKGTVIKTTGDLYEVKSENGDVLECRLKGKFRTKGIKSTSPVVVGDKVRVEQTNESSMIVELFDRQNYIIRKSVNLSKQTHIVAANVDQAILMVTIQQPITTTGFIDRFLAAAQSFRIETLIIFNKLDIYDNEMMNTQKKLRQIYERIGYSCMSLSVTHDKLDDLQAVMKNKVNVISGHSGVGKSTFINKLQPGFNLATKEISKTHKQGQHATTFSELYTLDFGGFIIDTPGIKGFGMVEMKKEELGDYFREFIVVKNDCNFHNCIHLNEPDCAVKQALANESIAQSRYASYLSMLEEEEENFRTNDY